MSFGLYQALSLGYGAGLDLASADYFNSATLKLVANNCRLSYTFNNSVNWCVNYWTKHRSGPSGFRGRIEVAYVNGIYNTNGEISGKFDFTIRAGLYVNGKFTQGVWATNSGTDSVLSTNWGTDSAVYTNVYIPPNTDFYTTCRTVAVDYATASTSITGFTNANPVVVSTAAHSYLAGQSVRIKDLLTTLTGTVTGATQANPCVITSVAHGLTTAQYVRFASVGGMTNLNWATNGNIDYKVVVLTADTFSLQTIGGSAINSTGYGAFTSGGTWTRLSELNYAINGSTAYTVDNPTATTFELSGINGTSYGVYGSGGTAERVYGTITSHAGTTKRADGSIASQNISADYTIGVGIAYGAKALAPVINSSGVVTSIAKDPNSLGANYSAGLQLAIDYGPSGVNTSGQLSPGATTASGYGVQSGGVLSSITVTGGGTGANPNNPPTAYLGGTGTAGAGFGNSTASYGPCSIIGIPDDKSVQSVLLNGDSICSGYGSVDSGGDIAGNYGVYEQALQNKCGVLNWSVVGESAAGYISNNTKSLALLTYLCNRGLRLDSYVIALGTNDFNQNTASNVIAAVQSWVTAIAALVKAIQPSVRVIGTTVIPATTSIDSFVTIANQTTIVVSGSSLNYQAGGRVSQYNTAMLNGTGCPTLDGVIDLASVIGDVTTPSKFKVAGTFYTKSVTATAFTGDGVHPNVATGIPYGYLNLDVSILTEPKFVRMISPPKYNYVPNLNESGRHVYSDVLAASAVSLTTATSANITSIVLSAGLWKISGVVSYILTGGTATAFKTSISKISATHGQPEAASMIPLITTILTDTFSHNTPADIVVKVPERSTATYYLVATATFSAGTITGYGSISATTLD